MNLVRLRFYDNGTYDKGASWFRCALWYGVGHLVFSSPWVPLYGVKRWLLRVFGARIGARVVIKPGVKVKYPWKLSVGDDTWIGEGAWIDNVAEVSIGSDCCVSQGAYLCSGNHDWSDSTFRLTARPIEVAGQVWIGAKALVGPGVVISQGAVIVAGSVMTGDAQPWTIYAGNPAVVIKKRRIDGRAEGFGVGG